MDLKAVTNTAEAYETKSKNTQKQSNAAKTAPIVVTEHKHTANVSQMKQNEEEKKKGMEKQIKTALEQANTKARQMHTSCEFAYHEETNRISITVKDKQTDEVIREIPAEETLKMVEKMWELAGILVDEKG